MQIKNFTIMQKIFWILILIIIPLKIIAGTCYVSGTNVSFGKYQTTSNSTAIGTFNVFCTDNEPSTFCIKIQTSPEPNRVLNNGGTTLLYQLYRDSSHTTVWHNNECFYATAICTYSAPCSYYIYGLIPSGQAATTAGFYSDFLRATLDISPSQTFQSQSQAYVTTGCNVSADLFNFGNYDPGSNSDLLAQASNIHITCSLGTTYNIGLTLGLYSSGSWRYVFQRDYYSFLKYNFYTNSSRTTVWDLTNTVSGTGTGNIQNYTVYGTIPKNQNVHSGGYSDIVTVNVTY